MGFIEKLFGTTAEAQVTALFPKGKSLEKVNASVGWLDVNGGHVPAEARDLSNQARAAIGVKLETQQEVAKMQGRVVAGHVMTKIQ